MIEYDNLKLVNKKLFENEEPTVLVHSTFKNFVCDSLEINPYTFWKNYHKLN